jgi:hypothetical protein
MLSSQLSIPQQCRPSCVNRPNFIAKKTQFVACYGLHQHSLLDKPISTVTSLKWSPATSLRKGFR